MSRPTYLVLGGFLQVEWTDLWQRQQEWVTCLLEYGNVVYLERAAAGRITPSRVWGRAMKLMRRSPMQARVISTPFPQAPEFVSWVPVPFSGESGRRLNARRAIAAAETRRLACGWEPFSLVHVGTPSEAWIEAAGLVDAPTWFDSAERFLHSTAFSEVPRELMERQVAEATVFSTDTELTRDDWAHVRRDTVVIPHGAKSWSAAPDMETPRSSVYYVGSNSAALETELIVEIARLTGRDVAAIGEFPDSGPWADIVRRGWVAGGDIPFTLSDAIAGLVPYRSGPWCDGIMPSKIFDYLLAGAPVISTPLPALTGMPWVTQVEDASEAAEAVFQASLLSIDDRYSIRDYALQNTWNCRFMNTVIPALETAGVSGLTQRCEVVHKGAGARP